MFTRVIKRIKKIILSHLRMFYFGLYNSFIIGDIRIFLCCSISQRIPKSTRIPHPIGIVTGGMKIGECCMILQNVTIGVKHVDEKGTTGPVIGNNVILGAGCVVLGDVIIGDNAVIGANAVVTTDVLANSIVVGVPAKPLYYS